jgi:hypothetical protein
MEQKPWYKSQTLLSLIAVAVGAFAPKYVSVIPPLVGDAIQVIGIISAGLGRLKATQPITFTDVQK